ncbi:MAG: hypothetical protein KAJ19_17260 [Gammaproteobacteria bacterium]|nr:hypothetical protein [Gammaproteobacteria bacterium]
MAWTRSISFDRSLADLSTGTVHLQQEGVLSVKITSNQLEELRGRSLVALLPINVAVVDCLLLPLFGPLLRIPGGCELAVVEKKLSSLIERIDEGLVRDPESQMIHFRISDPCYPDVEIAIPFVERHISFNVIDSGTGPRIGMNIKRCVHPEQEPPPLCDYCFRRWWKSSKINP